MRDDRIKKYYLGAILLNAIGAWGFWFGSFLCFSLAIIPQEYPFYPLLQGAFIILTATIFVLNHVHRLGALARAEDKRAIEFVSRAYDAGLSTDPTIGYFNDSETKPARRMASQLLENLHFTSAISGAMLPGVRVATAGYVLVLFMLLLWRDTELGTITVVAQVIFSEEVISKWVRLEWLHRKARDLFADTYRTVKNPPTARLFQAIIMEKVVLYERAKATAVTMLSQKLFDRLNPELSVQWTTIQAEAGIRP